MTRRPEAPAPLQFPPSAFPPNIRTPGTVPAVPPGALRHLAAPRVDTTRRPLEIWGGVECTINRVGNRQMRQLEFNGHLVRDDDLDRLADLGLRTLRFPLLWEQIAPRTGRAPDWRWADSRMARMRDLGIRPIVGLVHHGSGPRHAPMGGDRFGAGLGAYAAQVARRFPWVEDWTPVNEPLTTARFAGLYGLWYPHGKDARTFAACLMSEIEGTVQAMREIRRVNPAARLVQTDDLGFAWSTPRLAPVAEFENERRWLSWDLLAGRVDRHHFFHGWLRDAGVPAAWLDRLVAEPCTPDVIGINHYVTSERFLDERVEHYPLAGRRLDGPVPFVDVEAVRVLQEPSPGLGARLFEAWRRYGLPIAVTEVHLGCTREEQVRWLRDAREGIELARQAGADVRAMTVWALFGAYDWCSLLTVKRGRYESGAFDVRDGRPRLTALGDAVRALARGDEPVHPAATGEGWWRRPIRLLYPATRPAQPMAPAGWREAVSALDAPTTRPGRMLTTVGAGPLRAGRAEAADRGGPSQDGQDPRPLLVIGATGTLGNWFARLCELRGLRHVVTGRDRIDITDPESIDRALDALRPWAVVNCAGYVRVDDAERDRDGCFRANALGPSLLARACAARGLRMATFSSDLVFDGSIARPYGESAAPAPLNVYGESKLEAERRVLDITDRALVVRTSAFFSPTDRWNFVRAALDTVGRGDDFRAAADMVVSPTYVPDLVHATLDLLIDGEGGLRHLANVGEITWAELAHRAVSQAGLDTRRVVACESRELGLVARRPPYSVLTTERACSLPTLEDALMRFATERVAMAA